MKLICIFLVTITINYTLAFECGSEGKSIQTYNGKNVTIHKYPWLVHIRSYKTGIDSPSYRCVGSLIDDQHVVTTARCIIENSLESYPITNIDVYLGRENAVLDTSRAKSISKVWFDSRYKPEYVDYDFAILTLSTPVNFTSTVSPICLPNTETGLRNLTVAGWKTYSSYPTTQSNDSVLEFNLSYLDFEKCKERAANYWLTSRGIPLSNRYSYNIPTIFENTLCAVNDQDKFETCSVDTGAPLMHKSTNGQWYLIGLTSSSWAKCDEDQYTAGIYSRTLYHRDNIKIIAPKANWKNFS